MDKYPEEYSSSMENRIKAHCRIYECNAHELEVLPANKKAMVQRVAFWKLTSILENTCPDRPRLNW